MKAALPVAAAALLPTNLVMPTMQRGWVPEPSPTPIETKHDKRANRETGRRDAVGDGWDDRITMDGISVGSVLACPEDSIPMTMDSGSFLGFSDQANSSSRHLSDLSLTIDLPDDHPSLKSNN